MWNDCLDIAIAEFQKAKHKRWHHWAFIIQDKKIVEWGTNLDGFTDSIGRFGYKEDRHHTHAEVVAFRKARGIMDTRRAWTLVNIRLNSSATPCMSAPCSRCEAYVRANGCTNIVYTDAAGRFVKIIR